MCRTCILLHSAQPKKLKIVVAPQICGVPQIRTPSEMRRDLPPTTLRSAGKEAAGEADARAGGL